MNRMRYRGSAALLCSVALVAFGFANPAAAQTQQQPSPPQNQSVSDDDSEAIIVTAQKREEVLLEVPQSVTVIGGDTLERQQATNFQDYLSLIPGFSLESDTPGISRITLRGANTGGVASTVAVFMDEVPFGSSTGLANGAILSGDFDPFDLNRIEVLRGPQGTLYGASSFGGVIKYVTNAPRLNRFEARAQAGIEDTKGGGLGYNAAAVINAPLGDKAAIRVNGFWRKDPGYINSIGNNLLTSLSQIIPPGVIPDFPNGFPDPPRPTHELGVTLIDDDINDRKSYGARASLLFQPTDNASVRLTAFAQNLNTGATSIFEVDPETLHPLYGGLVQSLYSREPTKIKYRVYSGTVDWDLGFANLLSSTAYSTFSEKFERDFTFAFGPLVNFLAANPDVAPLVVGIPITDESVTRSLGVHLFQTTGTDKFTQEVRLSSPNNETLEWLIGAFYTHEKSRIDPQNIFATEFGTNTPDPGVIPLAEIFLRSKYDEYAGFANATWHIVPRFDLTLGGRVAHNKQNATQLISGPLAGFQEVPDSHSSETVFTYSVAPRFEVNDHTSIYARVATGYRPGGPNVVPPESDVPLTYKADRLTSWELGLKAEAPDSRLWSFEATAYHLDWKDIQLFAIVNQIGINANGGKARINGLEVSGALRPVRGLTISANGAYTDSKLLDDSPNPEITGGRAGDPLPFVPKWSGALHADYEFPIGSFTGSVGGSVNRVGKRAVNLDEVDENENVIRIPGYTEVDLRAGVNLDRWTVEAFVKNLFDKRGLTDAFGFDGATFPNGAAGAAAIRPRTFGLVVTARY